MGSISEIFYTAHISITQISNRQVLHMLEPKNFTIDKCEDCFRITRNDIDGDLHTHVKSYKLAQTIVSNVCNKKIPLHSRTFVLISMMRLSDDPIYIARINELIAMRRRKGKKQSYVNYAIKK